MRGKGELLESAVARQFVGFGGELKYPSPIYNAATLTYGITSNHPFHNGNKRAALVAMLCHLDKNSLIVKADVTQEDLTTKREAYSCVFDYIELFYNSYPRNSTLGYKSPNHFEAAYEKMCA